MGSTKNQGFEGTWGKLKNALNMDESCFSYDLQPKTTASVRKYTPMLQKLESEHNGVKIISVSKSSRNRFYRPITTESIFTTYQKIPGLTHGQVQEIYQAKCQDLEIPVLAEQEKRFVSYCSLYFSSRKFSMKDSGLGTNSSKIIGNLIKNSDYFAYINLSKNLFKDLGSINLVKRVALSNTIVHLDLSSNEISPEGSEIIIKILTGHNSLISLDLSSHEGLHRNRLALLGANAIGNMLKNPSVLSILNIAGTCIGPEGVDVIIQGLEGNKILNSLDLSNNMLGGKSIEKLAVAITNCELKELNISINKIGNEGCEFVALMICGGKKKYCELVKLDISNNEITTLGLSKIFAAMRINSQLVYLNLKKNDFSKGLSGNLNQFLVENSSLENLDLSWCSVACEGLFGIADGLAKNAGLRVLNLSNNLISDKGVEIIGYGLRKNKYLKALDLSHNNIKNKGGLTMAKSLQDNETLSCLYIRNNSLKDATAQKFIELCRWKKNILHLNLEQNPLDLMYLDIIKNSLQSNHNYQQRMLIPKIQEKIDMLQLKDSAIDNLHNKILQKQKEKHEIEQKLLSKNTMLEDIKSNELEKFEALKREYLSLREISQKISIELDEITNQINVKNI